MAKKKNISVAVRPTAADHGFNIMVTTFMVLLLIILIVPIWSTIALSFRPANYIGSYLEGMFLAPWKWSTAAYRSLLGNQGFLNSFGNSLKILVMGVATALFLTVPMAYALSVKGVPGKKWITIFVMIPYVFDVGVVPTYLLISKLGLVNHLPSVFMPVALSTYNMIIMRQFFEGIPNDLR